MLHEAAIKPWQYERLDLSAGPRAEQASSRSWTCMRGRGTPTTSTKDSSIVLDENPSIQAGRCRYDYTLGKPERQLHAED